jgi:hypothetical protein
MVLFESLDLQRPGFIQLGKLQSETADDADGTDGNDFLILNPFYPRHLSRRSIVVGGSAVLLFLLLILLMILIMLLIFPVKDNRGSRE